MIASVIATMRLIEHFITIILNLRSFRNHSEISEMSLEATDIWLMRMDLS